MIKASDFVSKALAVTGCKYWYACSGEKPTAALLDQKIKQFPGMWTAARIFKARTEVGKGDHVFDCIGLVRYASDMTKDRDALYTNANKLSTLSPGGAMNTLPELPGLLLFCPGHVGISLGGGQCVECWGFQHVAVHPLRFQKWTRWGRCPWVEYTTEQDGALYTVRAGDSWWKIAQEQLGSGTRGAELAACNGKTLQSVIHPGQTLKLPEK